MSLTVLTPGACSLLVDAGRWRHRALGVPVGGAADRAAWRLANALARAPEGAVALEVALSGPCLRANADVTLALFGAAFDLDADGEALPLARPFRLRAGQTLHIRGTRGGARAYLATPGGFASPEAMGSRSALAPLAVGDTLAPLSDTPPARRGLGVASASELLHEPTDILRVLPGPHADWLPAGALTASNWRVSPKSDRMGVRLDGPPLPRRPGEIPSEPVTPGTVQVTNDGKCIVLGIDGQTIGGYPKAAHVIRADWDRLARLTPGAPVRFEAVPPAEAEAAWAGQERKVREWEVRLGVAE